MKRCGHCQIEKPVTAFYERRDRPGFLSSWCKSCFLSSWCKSCSAIRTRELQDEKRVTYLMYERRRRLKRDYGITLEDYLVMFEAQGGVCAICQQPETRLGRSGDVKMLAVDHDHATGELRKLLCHHCNIGLRQFKDDVKLMRRAIKYLNDYPKR